MNERIKELMEQAMELVDPYALEGEFGPRQLNEEKFAELIVADCIKAIRDSTGLHLKLNATETEVEEIGLKIEGAMAAMDAIADLFGVE